jgi:hypothetical protein
MNCKTALRPASVLVACLLVALTAATSRAVIVLPKGGGPPIAGFLVRQDATSVVVREPLPDGTSRERTLPRAEIDDLIVTVSAERLESLRPDAPRAYRDYAEELAEKRRDPEARAAAVRLYLIAAYLAPEELGRSCLMGMAALSNRPAEQRKYRAMAYLLDPAHNRALLKPADSPPPATNAAPDADPSPLLESLQLVRQGKYDRALESGRSAAPLFERYGQVLSYGEFAEACQRARQSGLSDALLRRVLRLELLLLGPPAPGESPEPAKEPASASWLEIVAAGRHAPVPSLSLETITEFDPRQCRFRDGRWVEP